MVHAVVKLRSKRSVEFEANKARFVGKSTLEKGGAQKENFENLQKSSLQTLGVRENFPRSS